VIYFALVYFNWVPALAVLFVQRARNKAVRGYMLITIASLLELGALYLHFSEHVRLEGKPDQLYVWITPLLIALPGGLFALGGVVRSCRSSPAAVRAS
jgi:hypothetical protein